MGVSLSNHSAQPAEPAPADMNAASHFIVVRAPVERVYAQWARIEELPAYIPALREVRRIDETHFSYRWHPNGDDHQGVLQVVLRIPGRRIAWRTLSNGFMSGMVGFEPRSQSETGVTLKIRSIFDPPTLSQRVEEYLGNFKRLVESRESEI